MFFLEQQLSRIFAAALFVTFVGCQVIGAAPVLDTLAYGRYYSLPADPATYICSVANGGTCDGTSLAPGTNWTVNYHAGAFADFGILRTQASLSLTGDNSLGPLNGGAVPSPSLVSIGGRAGFTDSVLIQGGAGSGVVTFVFAVTGTSNATAGASARPQFQAVPVLNGVPLFEQQTNYLVTNGMAVIPLAFTFGQPLDFGIYFYALAQIVSPDGWMTGAAANADYSNTAFLSAITVRDSQGNAIRDFSITATSGTLYTASGVSVPEAGTLSLLGIGLAGIVIVATLRRRIA